MKAQITLLPCSRLAIFAICNVVSVSPLVSLHRKMIWLNCYVISQKVFKFFLPKDSNTCCAFLSALYLWYVKWRQGKMHVFSLSLLYYANAYFFGVIFMRRNLLNLEKVNFFTFVCILLLESHWASGLSSSNGICRYNDTCIFPDGRLGTGGWRRVTRLALTL